MSALGEARRAAFSAAEIARRLELLSADLEVFPPQLPCPWPLACVYNELLAQAKAGAPDDPVLAALQPVKSNPFDDAERTSLEVVGTVRALAGQVRLGIVHPGDEPVQSERP